MFVPVFSVYAYYLGASTIKGKNVKLEISTGPNILDSLLCGPRDKMYRKNIQNTSFFHYSWDKK